MLVVRVMAPPEDTAEASVVKVRPLVLSQHWFLDRDAFARWWLWWLPWCSTRIPGRIHGVPATTWKRLRLLSLVCTSCLDFDLFVCDHLGPDDGSRSFLLFLFLPSPSFSPLLAIDVTGLSQPQGSAVLM